ncbi:response regulator transcription factor [Streptomyces sp. NPDC088725]|uniref:response regulator transcription factor n=1 Tax=Streptomyces sp. NPDC088725 TaxID=3365873 RepID=UPI003805F44E
MLAVGLRWPRGGLLVYSAVPDPRCAARLFAGSGRRTGVGYLLQERMYDATSLLEAVAAVAAGGTVVGSLAAGGPADDELGVLRCSELEVLELMVQGRTNSAIAQRLNVSPGTVEKRAAAVFGKLGIPCTRDDNRGCSPSCATSGPAPARLPAASPGWH